MMFAVPKNLAKELGMDKVLLDGEACRELFETYEIVKEILDDSEKAMLWFSVKNPHLGEVAPINFFLVGRGHKVLAFVRNRQDENRPYDWDEDDQP